jgi:hypothetical protein
MILLEENVGREDAKRRNSEASGGGYMMQEHRQRAHVAGQFNAWGSFSESKTLGVTANLLELIGKTEEDQTLGS